MRPELFADAVDEKLDAATAQAHVDIELLAVHEDLAELAQDPQFAPS